MLRNTLRFVLICAVIAAGSAGVLVYQRVFSTDRKIAAMEQENRKLQDQKIKLEQVVRTLGEETRVAEVLVTDQTTGPDGVLRTTLLFVEYAKDGSALPARTFTIEGKTAHVDALVIKFDGKFVENRDALRGHSIALFYRIFGENQNPSTGARIDTPDVVPPIYRGTGLDPETEAFERELWKNFWKLVDDERYRNEMGVRVAQGESPWGPFEKDRLYTITVESDGGLNLTSEPLKGIYREALKHNQPG